MPELDDTLVDRIYEAAFDPDQWIAVIEGAARLSGSVSGALLVFDDVRPVSFRANGRSHDQRVLDGHVFLDRQRVRGAVQRRDRTD